MKRFIPLLAIILSGCETSQVSENQSGNDSARTWVISAPAGNQYTKINRNGITVIPNGRFLTPRGQQIQVAPHPYGLTLSPDGTVAITANSGTKPLSITIIRNVLDKHPDVQQVPPGAENDEGILASVFMGLAISPDNQTVYVGGGQENKIFLFDVQTGDPKGAIDCSNKNASMPVTNAPDNDNDFSHGYIGDLALSQDGKTLYAIDQINFRVVIVDTQTRKIMHNVPVGRYPFGIRLSPDGKKAFVANVGMYEYQLIPGVDLKEVAKTGKDFPVYAYQSEASKTGIQSDTLNVPGLGDPNAPESFSVWTIDVSDANAPKVTSKIKTGILVGQQLEDFPAVGGASPNSVVATDQYVFVSNGNNDCISVIDVQKDTVVQNIYLAPDERVRKLRGVIPFGLALSPDTKRLYVAESGINAVGVIDVPTRKVLGHIPVGWFPAKLAVSRDGKQLIVANAKGFGSGPNAGPDFKLGAEGSYVGSLMKGVVSVLNIPPDNALKAETQQVVENNFNIQDAADPSFRNRQDNPIPLYPKQKQSPIKHIVFVAKENRTYNEIFGQLKGGKGEPSLARFGENVTVTSKDGKRKVNNVTVMPNHLELARRFSISDNFYCDSDHSADGHRWLVNTYPNEWTETSVTSAYGGQRNMKEGSKAPGNLAFVGSSGAIYPEDYNEAGSMWEHLERNQIDFFNFGFGLEMAPGIEEQAFKYTGVKNVVNYPVPAPIFDKSSRTYATFNMAIPDQFRLEMFMKDFNARWTSPGKTMPSVLTVLLPQDHGSGERPKDGYPFHESYMADNDLALGRLVEFLSQTPYWKNMAIIVTEDDPQGGVDNVDAHRSVLMVISPYAKKNYVGHQHYSFGSIFKTMWNTLGIPHLNQYDAGATDFSDLFTSQPDTSAYNALPVDTRIFDPQQALDPMDATFNWKAVVESPVLDNPADMERQAREQDEKQKVKE